MQTQGAADLANLIDLAAPEPVAFWPPTVAWYVVFAILFVALAALTVLGVIRHKRNAYRRAAESELALLESNSEWTRLSALVKRTALAAFPRSQVASLQGPDWAEFLDRTGKTSAFGAGAAERLAALAYEPGAAERMKETELTQLARECRQWIRRHATDGADAC